MSNPSYNRDMSGGALAAAVRGWMNRARMKPAVLIRLSGLSRQTVYGILGGGGHPVTPTLMALAAALASRSLNELDPDPVLEPRIFRELVEATAIHISGEDERLVTAIPEPRPASLDAVPGPSSHAQTTLYEFFMANPDLSDDMDSLALLTNGGPLDEDELESIKIAIRMITKARRLADQQGR